MRANGAPSCTRLEVSLRTSQKHLANNGAVLTKAQLLNKISKHLPITNGALAQTVLWGRRPCGRLLPTTSRRSQGALRWRFYVLDGALAFLDFDTDPIFLRFGLSLNL